MRNYACKSKCVQERNTKEANNHGKGGKEKVGETEGSERITIWPLRETEESNVIIIEH